MACINERKHPVTWTASKLSSVFLINSLLVFTIVSAQLDLPPLPQGSSSPRPGDPYYNQYGPSTARPFLNPVSQFNGQLYSTTGRPDGYSSSTARYQPTIPRPGYETDPRDRYYNQPGINPDITNRGFSQDHGYDRNSDLNNRNDRNRNYGDRNYNSRNDGSSTIRNDDYSGRNPDTDDLEGNRGFRNNGRGDEFYARESAGVRRFLAEIDTQSSEECTNNVAAQWNFESDVNEVSQLAAVSNFICFILIDCNFFF